MPAGMAPGSSQSFKNNRGQMVRSYGPCIHVDQTIWRKRFFLSESQVGCPLETDGLQLVILRSCFGCLGLQGDSGMTGSLQAYRPERKLWHSATIAAFKARKPGFRPQHYSILLNDLGQVICISLTSFPLC